jgi:DNA-binding MarR family transcriptional regulator
LLTTGNIVVVATVGEDVAHTSGPRAVTSRTRPSLDETTGFRLGRLVRLLKARFAASLEPLGLTPPQAAVLRALGERSPEGVRAVARRLSADPMNVKHCADELEARGLLRSTLVPGDRRLRGLEPTALGREVLDRLAEAVEGEEEWFRKVLGEQGQGALAAVLARLEAALGVGPFGRRTDLAPVQRPVDGAWRGEGEPR